MARLQIRLVLLATTIGVSVSCVPQSITNTLSPSASTPQSSEAGQSTKSSSSTDSSLAIAKANRKTTIVSAAERAAAPDSPEGSAFNLVTYQSAVGDLAAYVTRDPGDGQKHPAIVWITGGDCNSIGDVWSPQSRENDQSARGFRDAGIVMMFPSLRGGNQNPGRREGFYGEVDDVIAAGQYLAGLPYVDADRIYLGGHSTGGTLVILVGESTDTFAGVFSLGPVAGAIQYGGEFIYCDPKDQTEIELRSPIYWLRDVQKPMFIFAGSREGNWRAVKMMQEENKNPNIHFFRVPNHDHFSLIAPLSEFLAKRIVNNELNMNDADLAELK